MAVMNIVFAFLAFLASTVNCLDVTITAPSLTSDSRSRIQNALNSINTAGGGTLYIKAGLYIVDGNFEMFSNTNIIGDGMDNTVIRLKNYAAPWWVGTRKRSGFLRATLRNRPHCRNLKVVGLTLDGNKVNQNTDIYSQYGRYGFFTEACDNVIVENVKIINWQGYGFDPHGWKSAPGGALWSYGLIINDCVAENNDWDGFTLDQTDGIVAKNNIAIKNGRHGFNVVTGSRNVEIHNATSKDNGYYYYTGDSGCGVTIQNNQAYGTNNVKVLSSSLVNDKRGGVCINDVFNIEIKQNNINCIGGTCMWLRNSRDLVVTNNYCMTTFRGIYLQNITNIVNTSNTVIRVSGK